MKMKYSKNNSGPNSSIGIMKFKESMKGPQVSPEFVMGFIVVIVVLLVILKTTLGL